MIIPRQSQAQVNSPEQNKTDSSSGAFGLLSNKYFSLAILALALLFMACVRFHLRAAPLERDEGEYAYSGQLILQGIPPYQLAYNMKFPGMYIAYAAIMALFGETPSGIHLGFLLVNAAAIILVYLLTVRLIGRSAAWVAAATYAYGSMSREFVGISAHATHFVVAFALGGLLLLLRDHKKPSVWNIFFGGVLLGISVLMKQHGAFFVAFAGCYLIYWHGRLREWKKLCQSIVVFSAGVWVPLVLTGIWLWRAGVFGKFYFWTILYARTYAGQFRGFKEIWHSLDMYTPNLIWVSLAFAAPALMIVWRKPERSVAVFITGLFFSSMLATVPGFNFTWHYFILPLPALCLLVGVCVSAAGQYFYQRRGDSAALLPFIAFGVALLLAINADRKLFFLCSPNEVPRIMYGPGFPFEESVKIADYLEQHSQPSDTIAIIGSEPQIYFYTHLHSATGYIYTYALMEPQPYALKMQKEMISEIEAARPEYLIFIDLQSSWIVRKNSNLLIFNWFRKYAGAGYEVVGAVDTDEKKVEYHWDSDAPPHEPTSEILIYKKRSAP
jgi:hypothetical protein